MYCQHCGVALSENVRFCTACGKAQAQTEPSVPPNVNSGLVGFSARINDPAFAKYVKNSNKWSGIFAVLLAFAAVIGFYIYGETSSEMQNPQALFIGLGIGGMFILIALFQVIGRKSSKTWDGTVVDKKTEKKII